MSLLYPIFIYLMLPITLILFYFIMTGSKESFAMFEKDVLKRLRSENKSLGRTARNTLFLMAFIFMILALSQPVIKEGEIVVEAKSADILIGIDISDSMMAEDRYPNRLDFAKTKAIELIKQAPHNRIGVLAFAKHDYIVSPLSFDHSSVAFLLSKVQTKNITEKGTRLDSMMRSAISMLEHADRKNLLLFTDGGDAEDFSKEIELAKANGLRLFIIGIGSDKGSPVRSSDGGFIKQNGNILISRLNPKVSDLATETGGIYIESVLGEEDIKTMLDEIESITQKATLKKETIPQYVQLFYYPLGMAVFFLFLAFSSLPRPVAQIFVLFALLGAFQEEATAGLLDFKKLQDAKEAYVQGDFEKSSHLFKEHVESNPSNEGYYNYANSLYKLGAYNKAAENFGQVDSKDENMMADVYFNMGNSYYNLRGEGNLTKSIENYEKSYKLRPDKETKENLDLAKKKLEEEKKKEENQQEQQNQKDSTDNNDSEENKDSKDKSSSENNNKSKDTEGNDPKSDDQQKSEQQKAEDDMNEKEQKSDPSQEQMKEKEQNQKERDSSEQKSTEERLQEKRTDENTTDPQKDEGKEEEEAKVAVGMKEMSELEAKKWLKAIQQSQKGHLYKMQDLEHDEDENEKPW